MDWKKVYWGKLTRRLVVICGIVLCFVILEMIAVSCTAGSIPTTSEMTSTISIRQTDAGQTITPHTGDIIEILLDEKPSTGYRWEVIERDPNILVSLESSFFYSGDVIPGSGGMRRFQFEVRVPGETVISFRLKRPWENEADAIDEFQVTIHSVKD